MAAAEKGQPGAAATPPQKARTPEQPSQAPAGSTAQQVNSEPSPNALAGPEKQGTRIDIYGAAQYDSGFQFGASDRNWFDVVRPTKLPSYAGQYAPSGNWFDSVRQSRFGVKTYTDTPLGELKTIFEFELFGTGVDAGQTTF